MGSERVRHNWATEHAWIVVYIVVLVSAVQWSESAIWIHISLPFCTPSPNSTYLGYHGAPNWTPYAIQHVPPPICFTHSSAQISIPNSYFIPHYLSPTHIHTSILYMCGSSCPRNRFICVIFLDSTYRQWYMILVFLFLTYFTPCNRHLSPSMSLPVTQYHSLLWLSNILLYICTTSLLCRWIFRLLPCSGFWK